MGDLDGDLDGDLSLVDDSGGEREWAGDSSTAALDLTAFDRFDLGVGVTLGGRGSSSESSISGDTAL